MSLIQVNLKNKNRFDLICEKVLFHMLKLHTYLTKIFHKECCKNLATFEDEKGVSFSNIMFDSMLNQWKDNLLVTNLFSANFSMHDACITKPLHYCLLMPRLHNTHFYSKWIDFKCNFHTVLPCSTKFQQIKSRNLEEQFQFLP